MKLLLLAALLGCLHMLQVQVTLTGGILEGVQSATSRGHSLQKRQTQAPTFDRKSAQRTVNEDTGTVEICVVGGGIAVDAVLKTTNCTRYYRACDGSDFIGIDETFTIGPGERRCFNITIVDDLVIEYIEWVTVLLTSAGPPHTFSDTLSFSIRNNDLAPRLDRFYTIFEEDTGTVEVCVVGGGIAVAAVLKTTNCTLNYYHACDGSDYIGIYETFAISPRERKCFNIIIVDDLVAERSIESLHYYLTSAKSPHLFTSSVNIYIRDNDAPTLDQSIARTTNDEDTGTVEICVVGGGIAVAAVLKTTNCTSDNYACDGSDYIGIDETFTVGPGERRCFNITIVDDVVAERSESVHVLLTSAGPPHIFSHSLYFSVRDNDDGECLLGTHNCTVDGAAPAQCITLPAGFRCSCDHHDGYRVNEADYASCEDIDECAFVIERCQQHTCVNTEGSFYCECNEGYVLDSNGTHCNDIDECESGTHNCSSGGDAPAQCINLPGDFRCSCDQDDEYTLSTSDYATCVGLKSCFAAGHRNCCVGDLACVVGSIGNLCYCNHQCHMYHDCCEDIAETCQEIHIPTFTESGLPLAGEVYTLVCSVEVSPGSPNVTWMHDGRVVNSEANITVGSMETTGTITTLTLTFNPLHTSHGGVYSCQSVVGKAELTETAIKAVTVEISISKVTITRDPPTRPLHNGNNLTLICTVILDTTVDTGVYVVAGWNGLGNMRYGTRPIMVSEGIYQSVAIFDSLQTSDSGNYICTASAHPSRRSKYIRKSEDVCNDINIFVDLAVTTSPTMYFYGYPQPDEFIFDLSENKYRAASGRLVLTCKVEGETGSVTYTWNSTLAEWESNHNQRTRFILTSEDSNTTHTCTAIDSKGNSGSASTEINIVGAGIFVSKGDRSVPIYTLPNNSLVLAQTEETSDHGGVRFSFQCHSASTDPYAAQFLDTNGDLLPIDTDGGAVHVTRIGTGASLQIQNRFSHEDPITENNQGVYTCHIPDENGTVVAVNIGIYPHGFNTPPSVTNLTYNSERRTLTCVSTGSPPTTVSWSKDGYKLTVDGTTYRMTQTVEDRTTSTYENVLALSGDDTGVYKCTVVSALGTSSAETIVPEVGIQISVGGSSSAGENYTITCSITVSESLTVTVEQVEIRSPNGQVLENGSEHSFSHTFNPLRVTDGGDYNCVAVVGSPYLSNKLFYTGTQTIVVEVPPPSVHTSHDASIVYAGSILTLTCTVQLDVTLARMLDDVTVTSMWTTSGGTVLSNTTLITVSDMRRGSGTTYFSSVVFDTVRTSDAGGYTCGAWVTPSTPSVYVTQSDGSHTVHIIVQLPIVSMTVHPNTTRLPSEPPYNTIIIPCTASAPRGVVAGKSFRWRRRIGSPTSSLLETTDNGDTIIIAESNLNQPVSTSVLTVRETAPGEYHYRCLVEISDIHVKTQMDVDSIHVTAPALPSEPEDLTNTSTGIQSSTVQWRVPLIAFTPETYVVHYGSNMDSLDSMSSLVESGDDFVAQNQVFRVEITGLIPGQVYYYQVNATNTEGSIISSIQSFTTIPSVEYFQLRLPMDHCTAWSPAKYDQVLNGIKTTLLQVIRDYCKCNFAVEFLGDGEFSCQTTHTLVTYRNTLFGTSTHSATQLLGSIENWVAADPAIHIGPLRVNVDSTCAVQINSLTDPECPVPDDEVACQDHDD